MEPKVSGIEMNE